MPDLKINDVPRADLEIHMGASLVFGCEWWADKAGTVPVAITALVGAVKADTTEEEVLLDFADHVALDENTALVNVPPLVTAALEPLSRGVWDVMLVNADGETKKVVRGNARIHRSASG